MNSPAVSIIVPVFKVTPYIAELLNSLRAQTFRDFEAILVNDGCPDTENLERALEPYRDEIVYLKSGKWASISGSRNNGIQAARGRYIAFLDGDDLWEPDYLESLVGVLESDSSVDLVAPNARCFGVPGWEGRPLTDLDRPDRLVGMEEMITREVTLFVGVTARREILFQAGLFDPLVRGGEDWDLWIRVLRVGGKILYYSRPVARYRLREGSMSMDKLDLLNNGLTVCRKHLALSALPEAEKKLFEATAQNYQANMDFVKGKQALYAGRRMEAIEFLTRANQVLKNKRIDVAILALKFAPLLLQRYVHRRYPTEYAFLH